MPRTPPPDLPDDLLGEPPTVKLLYLWIAQRGRVDMSQREIARALGITQANVSVAARRLRFLGWLQAPEGAKPRVRTPLIAPRRSP